MSVTKPVLVVIAGPNGSGKTETTKILRANYPQWTEGLLEVNPDNIAQQEFGSWNDPSAIIKAAQRAEEIREQCLLEQRSLLFETILSIPEKIDYIRRAKKAGYFVRLVYVATETPDINVLRVAWRVDQGGHSVPEDKIRSRYERSLKLIIEAARIADRAYFIDNSKDYNSQAESVEPIPVFRMANGVVAKTYFKKEDNFPQWTKAIYHSALKTQKSDQL